MLRKLVFGGLLMAAAVGGPMVYFGVPDYWQAVYQKWFASEKKTSPDAAISAEAAPSDSTAPYANPSSPGTTPVLALEDAFRFNVSTGWIMQRWPLVSTGLADPRLQGYRVPLVTGTAKTDLAGSLTYYFNPQQQVQRITFHGTTGDARELIRLLTTRYRFTRRVVNDPGLFLYEAVHANGKTKSTLEIRSAQVVKASDPYGRFRVDLIIERPS